MKVHYAYTKSAGHALDEPIMSEVLTTLIEHDLQRLRQGPLKGPVFVLAVQAESVDALNIVEAGLTSFLEGAFPQLRTETLCPESHSKQPAS